MSSDEGRVGELVERLLSDAGFRAEFRQDPAGSCRAMGLEGLAAELSAGPGVAALEARESKSSLAGVVMAVAAEGVAVVELQGLLHGHGHGLSGVDKRLMRAAGVKQPRAPRLLSGLMHRGGRGVLGGGHHPGQVSGACGRGAVRGAGGAAAACRGAPRCGGCWRRGGSGGCGGCGGAAAAGGCGGGRRGGAAVRPARVVRRLLAVRRARAGGGGGAPGAASGAGVWGRVRRVGW